MLGEQYRVKSDTDATQLQTTDKSGEVSVC